MVNFKRLSNHTVIKLAVRLLILLLNRLILLISTPIILLNVVCGIIIIIKNWSIKHTKELNV